MTNSYLVKVVENRIYYKLIPAYDEHAARREAQKAQYVRNERMADLDDWVYEDAHVFVSSIQKVK